jgi:hypothetical protein
MDHHASSRTARQRHDGWTPERRVRFLTALELTGSVRAAAEAAGMNRASAYRLRDRAGSFGRDWDAALLRRLQRLAQARASKATLLQREGDTRDSPYRPHAPRERDKGDSLRQNARHRQFHQPCRPQRRDDAELWALIDAAC